LVKPILKQLAEKFHATFVVFEYVDEFNVFWRVKEEGVDGIMTRPPGFKIHSLNVNAQGQLFLSYFSDDRIKAYVKQGLAVAKTEHTLVKYADLIKRIKQIREQGYAYQERESALSMKQIAVPLIIRNIHGTFALGCFLPIDFCETDQLREAMLIASSKLCEAE